MNMTWKQRGTALYQSFSFLQWFGLGEYICTRDYGASDCSFLLLVSILMVSKLMLQGKEYVPYSVPPLLNIYRTLILLEEVLFYKKDPSLHYTRLNCVRSRSCPTNQRYIRSLYKPPPCLSRLYMVLNFHFGCAKEISSRFVGSKLWKLSSIHDPCTPLCTHIKIGTTAEASISKRPYT